jgi:ferredoxin
MRTKKLHIDWVACDGRALCTELLPKLLTRDEWGYPLAPDHGSNITLPRSMEGAAREAVALCPQKALSIRAMPD